MKLVINHQIHYRYDTPVQHSQQYLRLTPQTYAHQAVNHWRIVSSPQGRSYDQLDGFANVWTSLTHDKAYSELLIMAQGEVELMSQVESIKDDRLPVALFTQQTEATQCHEALKDFAAKHLVAPKRRDLMALSAAILDAMPYKVNSTGENVTSTQAFDSKKGGSQEHTQVFLACVRTLGIPARYVSGYQQTSDPSHLTSHAWAEAYLDGQWYCFDTTSQLFTHSQHIQLAIGRDYLDAAPVRGVHQGGEQQSMQTMVQVLAV